MDRLLTVITPATSKDLTGLATVKAQLGISGTGSDAALQGFITAASVAMANICNGQLVYEVVQEQFRPYPFLGSPSLSNLPTYITLRRLPVANVVSIIEDDVTLVEDTDYEIDTVRGKITRLYNDLGIGWRFRKLVIQYGGGYVFAADDTRTLPEDLEQGVIDIVKDMWFASQRDPLIREENIPGVREVQYWVGAPGSSGWPPSVANIAGAYQRPLF